MEIKDSYSVTYYDHCVTFSTQQAYLGSDWNTMTLNVCIT